jgi:hypothetical protein
MVGVYRGRSLQQTVDAFALQLLARTGDVSGILDGETHDQKVSLTICCEAHEDVGCGLRDLRPHSERPSLVIRAFVRNLWPALRSRVFGQLD